MIEKKSLCIFFIGKEEKCFKLIIEILGIMSNCDFTLV